MGWLSLMQPLKVWTAASYHPTLELYRRPIAFSLVDDQMLPALKWNLGDPDQGSFQCEKSYYYAYLYSFS